jgi:hypothetical protein
MGEIGRAAARAGLRRAVSLDRRLVAGRRPYSAVVGSMVALTSEMLLAGNPAVSACFRISSALGARYTH